jgi:circadian clock protein KaiB
MVHKHVVGKEVDRLMARKVKKAIASAPAENVELDADGRRWDLRLYIAGQTPRSKAAYDNLRTLCERHIPGRYRIELIDLLKDPSMARADQILAIPTLIRKLPDPVKRIIGDLSDAERAMVALEIDRTG